jgi:MFS family permease
MQPMLAVYLTELQQGGAKWFSGVIFSLPGVAFVLTASLWTRLGEKKGFSTLIPFGLAAAGLFSAALSFANGMVSFGILYFLLGAFVAILRPAASALIALQVEDNMQGMAYGMQQSAFMVGGLVGPIYVGLVGGFGTRWIFTWIGVGLLLGALWLRQLIKTWDRPSANSVGLDHTAVATQ